MSEEISLTDAINIALGEYLKTSGGMMTNFVFCADVIDADGDSVTLVVAPDNASTASCIGLAEYAKNLYLEQQRQALYAYWAADDGDGD